MENVDVVKLTALANNNLTSMGNMNIYQETFETISKKVKSSFNSISLCPNVLHFLDPKQTETVRNSR